MSSYVIQLPTNSIMQHFISYPTNSSYLCGADTIGRRDSRTDTDPGLPHLQSLPSFPHRINSTAVTIQVRPPPTSQPNQTGAVTPNERPRQMTTPSYENTPHADALNALTAEEAAQRVGRSPTYFRVIMSKLNHGGRDLRTPAQPKERARRYDLNKLDAWVADGMPVPTETNTVPTPIPDARKINATATLTGNMWTVTLDEINQGTQTGNLRNAHRIVHALAVKKTGLAPDEVTIALTVELPTEAAKQWEEAKTKEAEAKTAATLAAKLSRQVVQDLQAQGCTYQDIGEMLGISHQRAQQLAKSAVGKES